LPQQQVQVVQGQEQDRRRPTLQTQRSFSTGALETASPRSVKSSHSVKSGDSVKSVNSIDARIFAAGLVGKAPAAADVEALRKRFQEPTTVNDLVKAHLRQPSSRKLLVRRPTLSESVFRDNPLYSPRQAPPQLRLEKIGTRNNLTMTLADAVAAWDRLGHGVPTQRQPDPERSLLFDTYWKARHIHVSPDLASISWRKLPYGGFVMSSTPLTKKAHGRWFEVRIDDIDRSKWRDGLGIGVAMHLPEGDILKPQPPQVFNGYAYEVLPDSWLVGYDGRAKLHGISRHLRGSVELPRGPWYAKDLKRGDIIGCLATPEGVLMIFVNDVLRCFVGGCNIPWRSDVYAVIDLDGCTQTVHFLDTEGTPGQKVLDTFREKEGERLANC